MQYHFKKLIVAAIWLCSGSVAFSQTLFTYGNGKTNKEEFLRAYNKNKPTTIDKEKALRDYLELYTNFKLKVKAAQELHLDTIAQIRYDVQNFRDQIAGNYLSNEKGLQLLTEEAAARGTKDLHVLYFSVAVPENASPADSMKAYTAVQQLYNALKKGSTAYTETVTDISAKYFPVKYTDAGFVTAFSVPYQFENIIYNTKTGSVSEPFRATKSWYLFKVTEERPDAGRWKAAQILFAYPPDADYTTKLAVKSKADSVYGLLKNRMKFDDAAKTFSEDRITYLAGGELPEFGTGKYLSAFENKVFALKKDNDISAPFETPYGYHIVKRVSHVPAPGQADAAYLADLKQKVMGDPRINTEKEQFAKDISVKTGYKRAAAVSDAELRRYADTLMKDPAGKNIAGLPASGKTIISFRDGTAVKGEEWFRFVKEYRSNPEQAQESNDKLWNMFASQAAINYYKNHLEDYNADFKYQMQEFNEGNMLFEIMERNVWSRAGEDTSALRQYYAAHKDSYRWGASADVIIINCNNEEKAAEAMALLKAGRSWETLGEVSDNRIQADSGRYEISQLPAGTASNPQTGNFSAIVKNADGTAAFVKYLRTYNADIPRSFTEARGLVINDYQNVLEQRWVAELRRKYPVKVNERVFGEMVK